MNLSAAEGGENAGEGKTEPQRQTGSLAPSEVANEIIGGRTNACKRSFQEKRMLAQMKECERRVLGFLVSPLCF